MLKNLPKGAQLSVAQAAQALGVSPDTLRRWEKSGRIKSIRTAGGHRRYSISQVTKPKIVFAKKAAPKKKRFFSIKFPTTQKIDYAPTLAQDIPALYRNLDWRQKKVFRFVTSSFLTILTIFAATQAADSAGMKKAMYSLSNYIPLLQKTTTTAQERKLKGQVLQAADVTNTATFGVNVATIFRDDVNIETNLTVGGDVALNGGNITSTATTFDLLDTDVTSLNIGGAATAISLGATTGTTTINHNLAITGGMTVSGTLTASGDVVIKGVTYSFPTTQGAASTFLKNNGSGTLSWSTVTTDLTTATGTLGTGSGGTGSTSFTAGSVIFADGTKLTQDNTNFYWDDTNNILRIGSGGSINPSVNLGADLGAPTLRWNNLYVGNVNSNASLSLTGQALFTYDPADTSYTEASVLINPTAPEANEWMLGIGQGGYQRAGVDAEGDMILGYNGAISAPSTSNPFTVYNHGETVLATLTSTGYLGVGHSSPANTLDTLGNVGLRGGFDYQVPITVTNGGAPATNYDVLVVMDTATLVTATKLQSDCDDLRFVDSDQNTPLTFWIEQGCNTATTQIWVRIPTIATGSKTIYASYGNASAPSGSQAWAGSFVLAFNAACPAGWSQVTALNTRFLRGATAYGATGGTATHTDSGSGSTTGGSGMACLAGGVGTYNSNGHQHSFSFTSNATSLDPAYIDVVYCSRTAPIDLLGTSTIGFFGTTPSGWTNAAALNGLFPRGNSSYGTTGGSDTHTSTVAATNVSASGSTTSGIFGGGNTTPVQGHLHSFSGTTSSTSHVPVYEEMIPATPNAGGTVLGTSITAVFTLDPPLGWTRKTSLDSTFLRLNSTSGGTGGSATHTHSFSATSGGPSSNTTVNQSGGVNCANLNHTHTVSVASTTPVNNLPLYADVLFYTRNNPTITTSLGAETTGDSAPVEVYFDAGTTNLGIGTITPLWKLHVTDDRTATASALIENISDLTSYDPTALILRLGDDATNAGTGDRFINFMKGNSTIIGKIQGNGSGGVLYTTTGTDFAEYFKKANTAEDLSPGDLVCISPNSSVTKCSDSNRNILGVVSDKAGFAGGGDHEGDPNFVLVGLLGQLDIKVATDSGIIKSGDALTASSIPGVAQKATQEGYIIGKALEDWEQGRDRLLTYISASWFNPDVVLLASGELEVGKTDESAEASSSAIANVDPSDPAAVTDTLTVQSLDANLINTANLVVNEKQFSTYLEELQSQVESVKTDLSLLKADLWASGSPPSASSSASVLGTSVFADVVVSGKMNVGGLAMDGVNNSLDAIGTLKIQSLALGSIEFQNNSIEMDKSGNLNIKKGVIIANANLRSSETLAAGQNSLAVTRDWEEIPVSITATPNYNTRVWISEKSARGFTINVETPPLEDATIDWIAIW